MTPYEYVRFIRNGSNVKEKGIYLAACTTETGDYLPRRVATTEHVKSVADVLSLNTVTIVKE